jgi:hypothetical protein
MTSNNPEDGNRKYLFVCGLQRSGTSILARNIASMANCTSFRNTGVMEDEGQYLQDVYPNADEYGGSGKFGFNPRAHLTETSELLTPQNITKLKASWHSHWENTKSIFLEKTPGNLLMTRFLQAAFPNSYFIVIKRHPVCTSMATQKWSITSLHSLFEHWLHCYSVFQQDKMHLHRVYELRYEDYVADPNRFHHEIASFIDTTVPVSGMEALSSHPNEAYLRRWSDLLLNSRFKFYYKYIAQKYEPRFAQFEYSLTNTIEEKCSEWLTCTSKFATAVGFSSCLAADSAAFVWRLHGRRMDRLSKGIRSQLPKPLKAKIKQMLRRNSLHWAARLLLPRWFAEVRPKARVVAPADRMGGVRRSPGRTESSARDFQ